MLTVHKIHVRLFGGWCALLGLQALPALDMRAAAAVGRGSLRSAYLLNEAVQGGALAEGPSADGIHAADLQSEWRMQVCC